MDVPSDFRELMKYSFHDYAFWHSPAETCCMDRSMPVYFTKYDDRMVIWAYEESSTENDYPWGFKLNPNNHVEILGSDFKSPIDAFEVARAALEVFVNEGINSPNMPSDLLIEEV